MIESILNRNHGILSPVVPGTGNGITPAESLALVGEPSNAVLFDIIPDISMSGSAQVTEHAVESGSAGAYISDHVRAKARTIRITAVLWDNVLFGGLLSLNLFTRPIEMKELLLWNWYREGALLYYLDYGVQAIETCVITAIDVKRSSARGKNNRNVSLTLQEVTVTNAEAAAGLEEARKVREAGRASSAVVAKQVAQTATLAGWMGNLFE